MTDAIRPWAFDDIEALRPLVLGFLEVGVARGSKIKATDHNATWFIDLGLRGAKAGDPCLVAVSEDGAIKSYIQWQGVDTGLELDGKPSLTFGAFTLPEYRSSGIATALRERALVMLEERGYTSVQGPVSIKNERGARYFSEKGAKIIEQTFELELA